MTILLRPRQTNLPDPYDHSYGESGSNEINSGYEECVETYTSLRETFNNPSSSQARYNSDIPAKNPRIPSHRGHLATHQGSLIKQATDVPRPQTKNNLFFPIRHWQGRTHHHSLTIRYKISHRIHITTRLKSTSITLELVMTPPMSITR